MATPHEALALLVEAAADGRLERICQQFGIDVVSVFGSVLDPGEATPNDLDVAIRFRPGAERDLLGVIGALVDLAGLERLDVMVLNQADVVARSRALGPGSRGHYERTPGVYALAQMAAITEEMDTAFMRRRDLELSAPRFTPAA